MGDEGWIWDEKFPKKDRIKLGIFTSSIQKKKNSSGVAGIFFFPTKNAQDDGKRSFLCPSKAVAWEGSSPSVAMGMIFPGNAAGGGEETPEIH